MASPSAGPRRSLPRSERRFSRSRQASGLWITKHLTHDIVVITVVVSIQDVVVTSPLDHYILWFELRIEALAMDIAP